MTFREFLKEFPKQMFLQWQLNHTSRQMDRMTDDLNFLKAAETARLNNENIFDRPNPGGNKWSPKP